MRKEWLIYIDRLREKNTEVISHLIEPSLLDLDGADVNFKGKIQIQGSATLVNQFLILSCQMMSTVTLPCVICNDPTEIPLHIRDFRHTVDVSKLRLPVYDYSEEIRTALLLRVPQFMECHSGNCPERIEVSKFFKKKDSHSPFSKLHL